MLVSASAGTGKTTVMIARIARLIADGADVSQLVVVTFTNLAAAEMKTRLADKLRSMGNDPRMVQQLEKLDTASISTIHSFCSDLLRNYFYVVDIDPSFSVLDTVTVNALRTAAMDDVFKEYFQSDDDIFRRVYKIFATGRKEENFKKILKKLYDFSRSIDDFDGWYAQKRQNFLTFDEANPVLQRIFEDIFGNATFFGNAFADLQKQFDALAMEDFAKACAENARLLLDGWENLQQALWNISKIKLLSLPKRNAKKTFGMADKEFEEKLRSDFEYLKKQVDNISSKYRTLCAGKDLQTLCGETAEAVAYTDKLVEILQRFEQKFFNAKKQRGGVDFNDLEHLALKILRNDEALQSVRERYSMVFVDEYQDTNLVQEAIISQLAENARFFMVGDIKQSIYGFRGCEPSIFMNKYRRYKQSNTGQVEEMKDNFRSNNDILDFVNDVFSVIMTESFGKVDYSGNARFNGHQTAQLKTLPVQIDFVVKPPKMQQRVQGLYDITETRPKDYSQSQGELIANKIKRFVGMAYKTQDGAKYISYDDIVILVRGMKDKAMDIYDALVRNNIPVVASLKTTGYANKEVRDIVNLLRAVDNPFNDVYFVAACLAPFGGFSENQLAQIKIASRDLRIPFYTRMQMYLASGKNDEICNLADRFLQLLQQMRFVSYSATVDEVVLTLLEKTSYQLYVQGFPNGAMRLRKLYAFVDQLKESACSQSVDKFLSYLDATEEEGREEGMSNANAVRLMTMHASKGLEFPVVFLAGLESRFVFDANNLECNTDLGLSMKYYNFDTMKVFPTLGATACGMFNATRQREEEMRLLYVAMTRAKFVLNIVATLSQKDLDGMPKQAQNAGSHLEWLLTALKTKYGTQFLNCGFVNVAQEQQLQSQEEAQRQLLCEQYTDEQSVLQKLNYVYPFKDQTAMPLKIVSSALDRDYIDMSEGNEFVLEENNDRNFVGTAYHKVYQYVDYNADKEEIAQTVDSLVKEGKIDQQYARQLDVDLIYATLNNPDLRKLLSQGKVYHEMSFMLSAPYDTVAKDARFSDEVMLQGVIDLLVLSENHATVVDFKYTTHSNLVKKSYSAQLASYRLAVQKICKIAHVDCFVLSIADNKLISMD